jgi:glycerophosphoryl diester phosphodiesterase
LLSLAKDRAVVIIEIKAKGMEQAVADVMRSCGAGAEDVVIFGWDVDTLDRMRAVMPDLTATLLVKRPPIDREEREALFRLANEHSIPILGVENRGLDRDFFRQATEAGLDAWVWTVNEPEEMRRLRDQGAGGIISDYADVARRAIASAV